MITMKLNLTQDSAGALSAVFVDGLNSVNQNNAGNNVVQVTPVGFSLSPGEVMRIAFSDSTNESPDNSVDYQIMAGPQEDGSWTFNLPTVVLEKRGFWYLCIQLVSDYVEASRYYAKRRATGFVEFSVAASFMDQNGEYVTEGDFVALWGRMENAVELTEKKTSAASPNTIMYRDENGRAQVESPVEQKDIVNLEKLQEVESSIRLQLAHDYYNISAADNRFAQKSDFTALQSTVSQNAEKISVNARNIQSLLAMQAKTVMEQTLTDSYSARQTADGALNIVDGALTYPTKISGKTVKTTNLFDDSDFINKPLGTFSSGKMSFKISAGTYTAIIKTKNVAKIQPNVTTLKLNDNAGICIIDILNTGNATTINSFNNVVTFTVSAEQASVIENVTFFFNSGNGVDYVGDEIAYIMINEGTSIKPYSPYFNGLKHAYFKGVRSIGRQLLDRNDYTIIDGNKYAYSVKALSLEKNYYIAANSAVIKYVKISVNTWSEWNVSFGSDWGSDYKQKAYFTTTKYGVNSTKPLTFDGKYIYIWVVDTANGVNRLATPEDIEKYEIMIYEGASDDYAYEEYKDDTSFAYTEAQGLKEYDYLLPQEGKKGEQTKVVAFDGTENWVEAPNTSKGYVRFYVGVSGLLPTSGTKTDNLVCNLYPNVSLSDAYHNGTNGIHSDENVSTIYFIDSNYSTLAEWKAHLAELAAAGNPLTVAYKTATATETDLKPEKSSYFANDKGNEIVDEGETKNSEYGAKVTIEQDYAVWIGGDE